MKKLFLAFFFLVLLSCAGGNVRLQIADSGEAELSFWKKTLESNPPFSSSSFVLGQTSFQHTSLRLESLDYTFQRVEDITLQDGHFLHWKGEGTEHLLVSLCTDRNAGWFQIFEWNEEKLDRILKEAESRKELNRFNNLAEHIVWEIYLPGNITSARFLDTDIPSMEWGIRHERDGKVLLKIPIRDILGSKKKTLTFEIWSKN